MQEQSTSEPPSTVGVSFAADVMIRERQLVLILRESVTSYATVQLIDSKKSDCLRNSLMMLCLELRPVDGPCAIIRTDPSPGFKALEKDPTLKQCRIQLELGRPKNCNKNPVAEKAVQEVENEIRRVYARQSLLTPVQLSTVIARLNSRIRGLA